MKKKSLLDKIIGTEDVTIVETAGSSEIIDETIGDDAFTIAPSPIGATTTNLKQSIVRISRPISKTTINGIIDSMKKGELCIVILDKIADEEAKIIYNTINGSIYTMEGEMMRISDRILLCAPKNFILDGDIDEA